MTYLKMLTRAAGLGLCVAALSGSALADPGKGSGNGPESTPPGQEKKAETPAAPAPAPAPQAAQGQEQKAENQAKQAAKKAAPKPTASKSKSTAAKAAAPGQTKKAEKADKPDKSSGSFKNTSSGNDLKKGVTGGHKHTICHATGSESNPFVRITPSVSGVFNGHMGHQGAEDIIPPFEYKGTTFSQNWDAEGQALFNANCAAPAAPAPFAPVTPSREEKRDCPTITRIETVVVGVRHATGAFNKDGTRKFVDISPSEFSAHVQGKHPDDEIDTRQVTTTVATGAKCESAPPVAQITVTPPSGQAPAVVGQVQAAPPAQAAAPVGGVAGAVSPAPAAEKAEKAEKPAGGVLGAIASAPEAVAETAVSGELPFTGIPLWIAALIGGALLATGLVLRRTTS